MRGRKGKEDRGRGSRQKREGGRVGGSRQRGNRGRKEGRERDKETYICIIVSYNIYVHTYVRMKLTVWTEHA